MTRPNREFWRGRRVLLTGHTGFKGSWLSLMLTELGAHVVGLALEPGSGPALFLMLAPVLRLEHHIADIRDPAAVHRVVRASDASIVFHLAAQALVPLGYTDPVGTFAANVSGTLHLLEAMRTAPKVEAAILATTDKVYTNPGAGHCFTEADPLGGTDPYSASKVMAEIAVVCWRKSFAAELPPLATARAGNVIGGGDFAPMRLVPDIVRALDGTTPLMLRYPTATRPWQHVLDVLTGYLLLAEHVAVVNGEAPSTMNFAPSGNVESSVSEMIQEFRQAFGRTLPWTQAALPPPEAPRLTLDPALAMKTLGWEPRFRHDAMIRNTAEWYVAWRRNEDIAARCVRDVAEALQ
jgi:CDP-glucose 4,6-dehydratase